MEGEKRRCGRRERNQRDEKMKVTGKRERKKVNKQKAKRDEEEG